MCVKYVYLFYKSWVYCANLAFVSLTGFDCRCGHLFCSIHRYSDVHNCSFDYKADAAEKIRKENPLVIGEKIEKIWVEDCKDVFLPSFSWNLELCMLKWNIRKFILSLCFILPLKFIYLQNTVVCIPWNIYIISYLICINKWVLVLTCWEDLGDRAFLVIEQSLHVKAIARIYILVFSITIVKKKITFT